MKFLKQTMRILILALLISATTSCQEKYPDLEDGLYAEFVTTKGTMIAKLHYDKVPVTVANFVALAEGNHPLVKGELIGKHYYDSTTFHRVIDKFMIQGGDPTATGAGDPGYKFESEFHIDLKHDKPGILSMANGGGINTNGSQFFIMEVPYPSLDAFDANGNLKPCEQPGISCHPVFGELVKGLEVQDSISNVKVINPSARNHKPVEDVVITNIKIIRKGSSAKAFDAPKTFTEELPKISEKRQKIKEEAEVKLKEEVQLASESFLKNNENLTGRRIESPTGMVMIFTHESDGPTPTSAQNVKIDCAGYLESGELFWTTWKDVAEKNGKYDEAQDNAGRYAPFTQPYNQKATLVAGFREAMLNMKVGDKARVFIPHYLGYGVNGRRPLIQPNTNLIFDIEIAGIE